MVALKELFFLTKAFNTSFSVFMCYICNYCILGEENICHQYYIKCADEMCVFAAVPR